MMNFSSSSRALKGHGDLAFFINSKFKSATSHQIASLSLAMTGSATITLTMGKKQ